MQTMAIGATTCCGEGQGQFGNGDECACGTAEFIMDKQLSRCLFRGDKLFALKRFSFPLTRAGPLSRRQRFQGSALGPSPGSRQIQSLWNQNSEKSRWRLVVKGIDFWKSPQLEEVISGHSAQHLRNGTRMPRRAKRTPELHSLA